jgi:Ca-activated chloride channel family protein
MIRLSRLSLVVLGLWCAEGAHVATQRAAFRSSVDLVQLNVSVVGPNGAHVTDLTADDFQIFEDGRPQQLAYFAPATVPLSVSLVLDTSSSMDEEMPVAQQAAKQFVSRLRPNDIAEIVSFDSAVEVLQPLTGDRTLLNAAIDRLRAGGSTALYNAVYIVLRQLAKAKVSTTDDIRRQIIVVLSDGEDTSSLVSFEQLLDSARRSQTVIFPVGLGLEAPLATKRSDGEFGLRQLARETGGRLFLPKRAEDLSDVYHQIAAELTTQYVLGYISQNGQPDGAWRRLAVQVLRPNMYARTRAGYFADGLASRSQP